MNRDYTQSRTNLFPGHVFPDRLQRIVRELHDSNGFPADYTAASMMAAISVAIGNSHRVEVKRNWHESAILYIAIVGRPGACLSACRLRSKNSHPLAFAMQPLVNADWKFQRGTTEVEGLSFIKDGQKFKASQVDRDGRCSYQTICNALDRNKNRQAQLSVSAPRPIQQQPKQAPSDAAKIIEAGADIAESLGNAVGGLFQVGPAYGQDEEAFIREMNRRKKRKRGRSL